MVYLRDYPAELIFDKRALRVEERVKVAFIDTLLYCFTATVSLQKGYFVDTGKFSDTHTSYSRQTSSRNVDMSQLDNYDKVNNIY